MPLNDFEISSEDILRIQLVSSSVTQSIEIVGGTSSVAQGASGSVPWLITGSVTVNNQPSITVSSSNVAEQGSSGSIPWKTIISDGINSYGTSSNNPLWISGTMFVNNLPVTQSIILAGINNNITQSITGTVGITSPVLSNQGQSGSISNAWPVVLSNASITASILPPFTAVSQSHNALVVGVSPNTVVKSANTDMFGRALWPTPFGEMRVASPHTLADLVNKYGINPRLYSSQSVNSGAVTAVPLQSAINLSVTNASGSSIKLRTNTYYRYQAGKAQRWRTTLYHNDTGQANQVRQWGNFDDEDGLFFELSGSELYVVQRSFTTGIAVDTKISQSLWNYDKMNGTGPSGITLDVTKGNIYECVFQWLGVGNVMFFIDGHLVHVISNPNTLARPYMRTAVLPLSWHVNNLAASTGSGFTYICSSIFSEGGDDSQYESYATYNTSSVVVTTTERPILSIRPKMTYNGVTNRMYILPFDVSISTEGNRAGYRIVMNSTLNTSSWQSVDSNSGVEYDIVATSGSGGQTLFRGFLPNSDDVKEIDLEKYFFDTSEGRMLRVDAFATSQDILTIYAINEGAGSTQMRASITWNEVK